jgi:hypothetical protein
MLMDYESLTEFPLRYQLTGNDADRDLLYSLHGFQLHSRVTVGGTLMPVPRGSKGAAKVRVNFQSFMADARDVYDWDYSEHLTVPNPDYGIKKPGAAAPNSQTVIVYHRNASDRRRRPRRALQVAVDCVELGRCGASRSGPRANTLNWPKPVRIVSTIGEQPRQTCDRSRVIRQRSHPFTFYAFLESSG